MKRISFLSAIFLSVLSFGAVAASTHVSSQDKTWLKAAHQVNLEEMQSGALAHQKGHSDAVRSTGETLASDHRKLDSELVPVAERLGVSLPKEPTAKARHNMRKLRSKSGAAFDKLYVEDEIKGHKKAISKTDKEIADGSSSEVKNLAQETLPVLKKHLEMLQRDHAQMRSGG